MKAPFNISLKMIDTDCDNSHLIVNYLIYQSSGLIKPNALLTLAENAKVSRDFLANKIYKCKSQNELATIWEIIQRLYDFNFLTIIDVNTLSEQACYHAENICKKLAKGRSSKYKFFNLISFQN